MFSFARMSAKKPRDLTEGMEIVIACLNIIWECQYKIKSSTQKSAPLKFWCLENPNGFLKYFLGNPVYEFNPYDFGDNWKKELNCGVTLIFQKRNLLNVIYQSMTIWLQKIYTLNILVNTID